MASMRSLTHAGKVNQFPSRQTATAPTQLASQSCILP